MHDGHASARVQAVFQLHGRGWGLELSDLEGVIHIGDWISGFPAPHQARCVQVAAVELVDRGLNSTTPSVSVAVVVNKLKASLIQALPGHRVQFSLSTSQGEPHEVGSHD